MTHALRTTKANGALSHQNLYAWEAYAIIAKVTVTPAPRSRWSINVTQSFTENVYDFFSKPNGTYQDKFYNFYEEGGGLNLKKIYFNVY